MNLTEAVINGKKISLKENKWFSGGQRKVMNWIVTFTESIVVFCLAYLMAIGLLIIYLGVTQNPDVIHESAGISLQEGIRNLLGPVNKMCFLTYAFLFIGIYRGIIGKVYIIVVDLISFFLLMAISSKAIVLLIVPALLLNLMLSTIIKRIDSKKILAELQQIRNLAEDKDANTVQIPEAGNQEV